MGNLFFRVWVAFAVCMLAVSVIGCEEETETDGGKASVKSKNLVTGYVFPESMSLKSEYDSSCVVLYVHTDGLLASRKLLPSLEFRNLAEEELSRRARLFDSMSVVYKDTAYNGYVPIGNFGYCALAYPIDTISIVCDANYDEDHPAGTDLSDVVYVTNYSFGNNVLSGYEIKLVGVGVGYKKKVSELTPSELTLFGANYFGIYSAGRFTIPQTSNPQDCQLTVTYLFSNGLKLSASAQVKL